MALMQELYRDLHTLKGSANMVGITPVGELSHQLESILKRIVEGTAKSSHQLQDIIQNSVDELAAMVESVRSGIDVELPIELINQIKPIVNGKIPSQVTEIEDDKIESQIKSVLNKENNKNNEVPEFQSIESSSAPSEEVIEFLEESEELLNKTQSLLVNWKKFPDDLNLITVLSRGIHTLKGGANQIGSMNEHQGMMLMGKFSHILEDVLDQIKNKTIHVETPLQETIQQSVDELVQMQQSLLSGKPVENPTVLIEQLQNVLTGKFEQLPLKTNHNRLLFLNLNLNLNQ
ncbi:histidine kinase [Beggiatoa sp. PS]|nr:histidine kinase [Beggiatoa sp. PS]